MAEGSAINLLHEIMLCSNVSAGRSDASSPCHTIVSSQNNPDEPFQLPEPWSGDLENAPILFIGSNPSISYDEDYPLETADWPRERATRFFTHRFQDGWVKVGRYGRFRNGEYSKRRTSYWSSIMRRAMELLERDVRPARTTVPPRSCTANPRERKECAKRRRNVGDSSYVGYWRRQGPRW